MDTKTKILTYRPMSHMLRSFVVPEIEGRIAAGTLAADQLPFQLNQFQFLQGDGQNIIEINDDVRIVANVWVNRATQKGERLTLTDIHTDRECLLEGPTISGKPAAFFLCYALFLNFYISFDFTPNIPPELNTATNEPRPIRFPFTDIARANQIAVAIQPIDKYRQLAEATWPPGPGHYPNVILQLHQDPDVLQRPEFSSLIAASYDETYWNTQLAFWTETKFFGDRIQYVTKAIDEYLAGDFVASIYVLVPHFEGIVKDYLSSAAGPPSYKFESCVRDLKRLVLSRKILMFPRPLLDQIFGFIETGTFLTHTDRVHDPAKEVTRHGIAHGVFKNFENRDINLKYLILLDALAYVLLHDKLLAGTL